MLAIDEVFVSSTQKGLRDRREPRTINQAPRTRTGSTSNGPSLEPPIEQPPLPVVARKPPPMPGVLVPIGLGVVVPTGVGVPLPPPPGVAVAAGVVVPLGVGWPFGQI